MRRFVWLCAVLALCPVAARAADTGWRIDEPLKIQIVYLPGAERGEARESRQAGPAMEPMLGHIPAYAPDIDNIGYKDILGLGFPLPARSEASSLKLYLKLYAWPAGLDSARSSHKVFDDFLLYGVPGGERLYEFAKQREHLAVKYASIDASTRAFDDRQPFRPPAVPSQWEFDSRLPFSSIYVTPENAPHAGTETERARESAQGVVAFHAALSRVYAASLHLLAQTDERRYFADVRRCPESPDRICGVRVYEVPVRPLVFANYRDLPMPQDASRVFLSGLLLVKLTEYAARPPLSLQQMEKLPRPGERVFDSAFRRVWSHMLEVASVLDTRS